MKAIWAKVAMILVSILIGAGIFMAGCQIGHNQAIDNPNYQEWTVWIDEDYNVVICNERDAMWIVPWGELEAIPEDWPDVIETEDGEAHG